MGKVWPYSNFVYTALLPAGNSKLEAELYGQNDYMAMFFPQFFIIVESGLIMYYVVQSVNIYYCCSPLCTEKTAKYQLH